MIFSARRLINCLHWSQCFFFFFFFGIFRNCNLAAVYVSYDAIRISRCLPGPWLWRISWVYWNHKFEAAHQERTLILKGNAGSCGDGVQCPLIISLNSRSLASGLSVCLWIKSAVCKWKKQQHQNMQFWHQLDDMELWMSHLWKYIFPHYQIFLQTFGIKLETIFFHITYYNYSLNILFLCLLAWSLKLTVAHWILSHDILLVNPMTTVAMLLEI